MTEQSTAVGPVERWFIEERDKPFDVDELIAFARQQDDIRRQLVDALKASPCDGTQPSYTNCDVMFLGNIPQGKDAPLSDEMRAEWMRGETPCARCAALRAAEATR